MADVGTAIQKLQARGCGFHADPFKNWDLSLIADLAEDVSRDEPVLDVGCGESRCSVLRFLSEMGFKRLYGIDLRITLPDRLEQFLAMRNRGTYRPTFRLQERSAIDTRFPDEMFGLVTCVSTIEHGVPLPAFFREMSRILKPEGRLLLTTDYWHTAIDVGGRTGWGLPWHVFSQSEIAGLVDLAETIGLVPIDSEIPASSERPVRWGGAEYTFLALVFKKRR